MKPKPTPAQKFNLTPKQAEVAAGIHKGWPDSFIAEQMKCSIHTVRSHLVMLYQKMGVENRVMCALEVERLITSN